MTNKTYSLSTAAGDPIVEGQDINGITECLKAGLHPDTAQALSELLAADRDEQAAGALTRYGVTLTVTTNQKGQ